MSDTTPMNQIGSFKQENNVIEVSRLDLWHMLLSTVKYCFTATSIYTQTFPIVLEKYLPVLSAGERLLLLQEISRNLSTLTVSAEWDYLVDLLKQDVAGKE